LIFLLFFADFGVLGDARIPEMKKSRVCTQETGGGDSSPKRAVRTGKIPRKMRVSLRCPYGRMTYTGSNGRQNALSAVRPSPTAPIADDTIVLPIIPIPMKFVNIFLLFSLDSRKKSKYNREAQGALPLDPAKGSSTLWTPFFAIELVALSCSFRVQLFGASPKPLFAPNFP